MTLDEHQTLAPDDDRPPALAIEPRTQRLAIRFTSSGSEYFRLWLVNLLLTLATLSLYAPFARARRLRYFYGNTLVGGHALGFHGDPWKMLRGHVVVLLGTALYLGSAQAAPAVAGTVALAFGALWPALWQASLRFRLGNTSWRGLRLHFGGSYRQAYAAMLPAALPAALSMLGVLAGATVGGGTPVGSGVALPALLAAAVGLSTLLLSLGWPWLLARIKRYQHNQYGLAQQRSRCTLSTRSVYQLIAGTSLWALLGLVLVAGVLGVLAGLGVRTGLENGGAARGAGAMLLFMGLTALAYGALALWAQARVAAGLQNLVWGATRSPRLQFHSDLRPARLAWRQLRNLLLTLLTLGLYRPFAAVDLYRLRVEAVSIDAQGDLDQWAQPLPGEAGGAVGDAAGDLLGVDLGL